MTKLTRERAFSTIRVVALAMLNQEKALRYSDLAKRLGMPNETGQGLGPILDEAAAMCAEHKLPDVSSVVVTKESIDLGRPFPSLASFEDGVWAKTGLRIEDVRDEQEKVRQFDWKSVRSLKLSEAT